MLFKLLSLLGRNSRDIAQSQDESSTCYDRFRKSDHRSKDYYDPEDRDQTLEDRLNSIAHVAHKRKRR